MQASTRLEMVVINDAKYVYFVGTVDDVLFFFLFLHLPSCNGMMLRAGLV